MTQCVLERPVRQHGTFVLPEIASDVPFILGDRHLSEMLLAKFSLAAERAGMQYPGGKYTNLQDVIAKQLQGWIDQNVSKDALELLAGNPSVEVSNTGLKFFMISASALQTFRLKPVVEALEAVKPGLGWFVADVITSSSGNGMNVYGPSLMGYRAEAMFYGATSDAEFAKMIAEEGGDSEPESEDEILAVLRDNEENFPCYPSDVLSNVGGHAHLLGWGHELKQERPKILDLKRATRAIKGLDMPQNLRSCVEQAIALKRLYDRDKTGEYCWNGEDDADQLGAVFMLAWDDPYLLYELVEHEETDMMNSGTGMECLLRLNVPAEALECEFDQLARKIRAYFEQWSALGKLMRHFYEEGNQDED